MTSKLEETFNLAPMHIEDESTESNQNLSMEDFLDNVTLENIDKIDAALPAIRDLTASDKEFDDIAELATQGYKDLTDLGMNVEIRYGAEIFGAASNLLGHALTAKKNKVEKKLKIVELQLRKLRLDQQQAELEFKIKNKKPEDQNIIDGEAEEVTITRNDLLARLLNHKS